MKICATASALVFLLPAFAHAQDSQFYFDPNGNLFLQTAATIAPPQIIGQPQNSVVAPGEAASFFVVALDTRALTYEWRFNGTNISGATNDAVLLQNASTTNEGQYDVVLTNPSGSVTSAPAFLIIDSDADGVGDTWESAHFGNLTNFATADFDGDGVSNLQEFLDGTNPTNTASALFRLTVARDGGSVVAVPDQATYTNGQTVMLTATAFSNDLFHAWLGDIVTRSNIVTLVMTNNKTVSARFTPIVFTWTNFAGGNWNAATNWTPNLVPGSNDSVVISGLVLTGSGSFTVTLDTPADCASVTLDTGLQRIPTLTGSGTLTVRESLLWRGGTMSGNGRTVLESGARFMLDTASGLGNGPTLSTRTLELGGDTFWTTAGNLALNSAVITNRAGAVFHASGSGSITRLGGTCQFDNAGTFHESGNPGTTTIPSGISFNNYGTVEIQTGTLELAGGGTHSGSFDVPSGTALILSGGTHSANGSSSITGGGQFTVSGGTATLAGLVHVSGSHTFSGGTANLTGNYICTNNLLTIAGGAANLSGTGLVSPAVLDLSNAGTLTGTSVVTVNSVMNWTSGTLSGSGRTIIPTGATLNAAFAGVAILSTRTLENGGNALFSGAGIWGVTSGAVITNRAGALFRVENEHSIGLGGGAASGRFDNVGIFRKSAGTGTTTVTSDLTFNNSGTVEIQTGTLELAGGGTHNGSFDVPSGTALILSGGTHSANGSSSITGGGQFTVSGGTANLAGLVNVTGSNTFSGGGSGGTAHFTGNYICTNSTLTILNGTVNFSGTGTVAPAVLVFGDGSFNPALTGSSPVTVLGNSLWVSGNMSGSGRTILEPAATLNLANPGGGVFALSARTLENRGTILVTGAGSLGLGNGAVITNRPGALVEVGSGGGFSSFAGANRFDNAGTFRRSGNSGTTTFPSGLSFNNSGTVDIRNGTLAANGGYTSTSSALLSSVLAGITPGVGYGQLQVAGSVTLAGNLSVALTNGFVPPVNSLYTVLSAGSRSGSFANFFYPTNDADMVMSNTPSSVVVRALGPYFATTTLPDAMRNVGYTQQVTAVMNSGPIVYSVIAGVLPDGLSFSSGGLISGIPTVFGNSIFTIQASNAAGVTIQQAFNLRVRNLPPDGLISWWRAENNALDSIGTNHGVLTNGATFAAGNVGQTFALDGVDDYVNVSDSPSLRPASLTLEVWVKVFATNGIRHIFGKTMGTGGLDSYAMTQWDGSFRGGIADSSGFGPTLFGPTNTVPGQWYHVAFTFDEASKLEALYVNGVLVASAPANKTISYDTHPLLLGADIESGVPSFFLDGQIDEPAIYNRALSSNEIAAIYLAGSAGKPVNAPYFVMSAQLPDAVRMVGYTQQVSAVLGTSLITFSTPSGGLPSGLNLSSNGTLSGIPLVGGTNSFVLRATDSLGAFTDQQTTLRVLQPVTAPSGLISWWRAEGNALDSAGTNHGTASNGVMFVEGKVGQGFGFDGINDHVFVPDATNLRPTSITLEAWAKFNGTQGPVLGRSFGSAIHNSYVIWQLSGNINGAFGDANQGADVLSAPFAPATGQWYHVAFTFDDATKQQALYLDGAVVASGQSFRTIGYDNHPVLLGGDIDNGTVSFLLNGGVDEASIYNRALTAGEITAIYNAGIAGKQIFNTIPVPVLLMPELVGSNVKLTWTAVSNVTYRLEFNPDLMPSNWTAVPGDVTTLSNTASKLDSLTPGNRLYRVRVVP